MNSKKAEYLKKSGFATQSGGFRGRVSGMQWFIRGNKSEGSGRSFITDPAKGEPGDIVFMGEDKGMQGHAVLLVSKPEVSKDGNTIKLKTLSTGSSENKFGERDFILEKKDNEWIEQNTGYKFRGIGQLHDVPSDLP